MKKHISTPRIQYSRDVFLIDPYKISVDYEEHDYVCKDFADAAKEGTLKAWEARNIPPIPLIRVSHPTCLEWNRAEMDGQTRLNSAKEAGGRVPVIDVTRKGRPYKNHFWKTPPEAT